MRHVRSILAALLVSLVLILLSVFPAASAAGTSPMSSSFAGNSSLIIPLSPCLIDPASCSIPIPDGSVVGELPLDQIAFYEPGKITAPNVIINAGTYWVTGIGTADDGSQFYRIVIGCQYLYVPIDTMQPSYQAPWNGEPLPTNEVSVDPPNTNWCTQFRRVTT